jgi:hypothetical protein
MTRRDDKLLRQLLPPLDSPYNLNALSQVEADALEEALADGFGAVNAAHRETMALPDRIKSGLLRHSIFADRSEQAFLDPEPFLFVPLGFELKNLYLYFRNQLYRFCHRMNIDTGIVDDFFNWATPEN